MQVKGYSLPMRKDLVSSEETFFYLSTEVEDVYLLSSKHGLMEITEQSLLEGITTIRTDKGVVYKVTPEDWLHSRHHLKFTIGEDIVVVLAYVTEEGNGEEVRMPKDALPIVIEQDIHSFSTMYKMYQDLAPLKLAVVVNGVALDLERKDGQLSLSDEGHIYKAGEHLQLHVTPQWSVQNARYSSVLMTPEGVMLPLVLAYEGALFQ